MNKILVAMSGGVDSTVTAKILKDKGFEIAGATLLLHDGGLRAVQDAKEVAEQLNIEHYVIDGREYFEESVISNFINGYENCETPNPCVFCNRYCKFELLIRFALQNGFECIASGHYASIVHNEKTNRYEIHKGKDLYKDQSYVLYKLTQEQLSKIIMPLGAFTKDEIRQIALEANLHNAQAKDSQDICFVPDGDYASFIENYYVKKGESVLNKAGFIPGNFVDINKKVLGQHKGLIHYTVGQRKGLGLSLPAPLYVKEKNKYTNEVVLCSNDELFAKEVEASDYNLVSISNIRKPIEISAKIRYSQNETKGLAFLRDGKLVVIFNEGVRAPAKGQSIVLYDKDVIVGGGIIC